MCTDFTSGIYYGWVQIGDKSSEVYPMVMSLGWNPYYQNEKRSAVWMMNKEHGSFLWYLILGLGGAHYP